MEMENRRWLVLLTVVANITRLIEFAWGIWSKLK